MSISTTIFSRCTKRHAVIFVLGILAATLLTLGHQNLQLEVYAYRNENTSHAGNNTAASPAGVEKRPKDNGKPKNIDFQSSNGSTGAKADTNRGNHTHTKGPVKVLLITYMRSGSTFAGEFFGQNPEAFYWFEPIDGVISHLYGSTLGIFPIDITQHRNGTDRHPRAFESRAITDAILKILNCKTNALPLEVRMHDFMHKRMRESAPRFTECFDAEQKRLKDQELPIKIDDCKQFIKHLCGKKGDPAWEMCHFILNDDVTRELMNKVASLQSAGAHELKSDSLSKPNTTLDDMRMEMERYISSLSGHNITLSNWSFENLLKHHVCINEFQHIDKKCSPHLESACSKSHIRAAKTIRITMEHVADILARDKNVRVLYLLRDPRAIVHSRYKAGVLSIYTQFRIHKNETEQRLLSEAQMLCHRMRKDIKLAQYLSMQYPYNYKEIRYEQIARNPLLEYQDMYRFLGLNTSSKVEDWIYKNTHAKKMNYAFGTVRRNSTETALAWEKDVSFRIVKEMTAVCQDVLDYLGFPTEL